MEYLSSSEEDQIISLFCQKDFLLQIKQRLQMSNNFNKSFNTGRLKIEPAWHSHWVRLQEFLIKHSIFWPAIELTWQESHLYHPKSFSIIGVKPTFSSTSKATQLMQTLKRPSENSNWLWIISKKLVHPKYHGSQQESKILISLARKLLVKEKESKKQIIQVLETLSIEREESR